MTAARLTSSTVVRHPDTGALVFLASGAPCPDWAAERVGDHLLGSTTEAKTEDDTPPVPPSPPAATPVAPVDGPLDGTTVPEDGGPNEPPRAGRGSGLEAWTGYVTALGLEVPADATRDQLIELVDQHNGN